MLINDADWELLVSTSSDTTPAPAFPAPVGNPGLLSGLGSLFLIFTSSHPQMSLFLCSVSNEEGGKLGAYPSWRFES